MPLRALLLQLPSVSFYRRLFSLRGVWERRCFSQMVNIKMICKEMNVSVRYIREHRLNIHIWLLTHWSLRLTRRCFVDGPTMERSSENCAAQMSTAPEISRRSVCPLLQSISTLIRLINLWDTNSTVLNLGIRFRLRGFRHLGSCA